MGRGERSRPSWITWAERGPIRPSTYVWPFKVYTGGDLESFGGKPIYQWVDDVTFDDEPPINLPAAPSGEGYTCETP